MVRFIKQAFLYHWNLLYVIATTVAAFISGYHAVFLPLIAALEILYLAVLATNSRFQDTVIAAEQKIENMKRALSSSAMLKHIIGTLNEGDRIRYENLRALCLELRNISNRVKGTKKTEIEGISNIQVNSINRFFWMYLKLLYSKNAFEAYFNTININEIELQIKRTENRLEAMGSENNGTDPEFARRESLIDILETSRKRLENYRISTDHYHFIELELERIYVKIANIAEMGINQQDPNLITNEISVVSDSIEKAERTMSELDLITRTLSQNEEPPEILFGIDFDEISLSKTEVS